jgi:hypothetical protein
MHPIHHRYFVPVVLYPRGGLLVFLMELSLFGESPNRSTCLILTLLFATWCLGNMH